jgi:hypothetical protein
LHIFGSHETGQVQGKSDTIAMLGKKLVMSLAETPRPPAESVRLAQDCPR